MYLSLGFKLYWARYCPPLASPLPTEQEMFGAKHSNPPKCQQSHFYTLFQIQETMEFLPKWLWHLLACMRLLIQWEMVQSVKGRRFINQDPPLASCSRLKNVRHGPDNLNSKAYSFTLSPNFYCYSSKTLSLHSSQIANWILAFCCYNSPFASHWTNSGLQNLEDLDLPNVHLPPFSPLLSTFHLQRPLPPAQSSEVFFPLPQIFT